MARLLVLVTLAAAVLAGCGRDAPPAAPAPAPEIDLRVTASDGSGPRETARVRCTGEGGRVSGFLSGRDPTRTCAAASRLARLLTEPPPGDRTCASVYGGPETARVTGRLRAERVDRSFAHTNACESDEWEAARALLPRPAS